MRLKLTREGLLVELANHYTSRSVRDHNQSITIISIIYCQLVETLAW